MEVILVDAPLLNADGAAALLGITRDRLYDIAASRDAHDSLPAIRIGRTLRFRVSDIDAYVERHVSDRVMAS